MMGMMRRCDVYRGLLLLLLVMVIEHGLMGTRGVRLTGPD